MGYSRVMLARPVIGAALGDLDPSAGLPRPNLRLFLGVEYLDVRGHPVDQGQDGHAVTRAGGFGAPVE